MVFFPRSLIGAAALLSVVSAAPMLKPRAGSVIGSEEPVSAPNGIPMSDPITSTILAASAQASPAVQAAPSTVTPISSESWSAPEKVSESSSWSAPEKVSESSSWSSGKYGSGSESWVGSSYDDCVQKCGATYGGNSWTPSTTEKGSSGDVSSLSGDVGSQGATHTVIVAPTQGVLRYIPFSLNASVGDTIEYVWGAGPHTVTRSSALEICNKTNVNPFASGQQQKDFHFKVQVKDTKPIWFYCGVKDHCAKGMFGGVNIGQANPSGISGDSSNYTPLSSVMSDIGKDSQMTAMWSWTKSQTKDNGYANSWGMNVNVHGMSNDVMKEVAQNVMYGQVVVAMNPNNVKGGNFVASNDMTLPKDISEAIASAPSSASGSSGYGGSGSNVAAPYASSDGSGSSTASASPSTATTANNTKAPHSGAASIASSSVVVGLVAVAATFFAL